MADTESGQVFDLSGAMDDLFESETTLKAVSDVEVPHAADAMALAFEDVDQVFFRSNRRRGGRPFPLVSTLGQIGADAGFDQLNQFTVHELIVVRNIQHVQRLEADSLPEISFQTLSMLIFHDEDDIRPLNVFHRDLMNRGPRRSSRTRLKA